MIVILLLLSFSYICTARDEFFASKPLRFEKEIQEGDDFENFDSRLTCTAVDKTKITQTGSNSSPKEGQGGAYFRGEQVYESVEEYEKIKDGNVFENSNENKAAYIKGGQVYESYDEYLRIEKGIASPADTKDNGGTYLRGGRAYASYDEYLNIRYAATSPKDTKDSGEPYLREGQSYTSYDEYLKLKNGVRPTVPLYEEEPMISTNKESSETPYFRGGRTYSSYEEYLRIRDGDNPYRESNHNEYTTFAKDNIFYGVPARKSIDKNSPSGLKTLLIMCSAGGSSTLLSVNTTDDWVNLFKGENTAMNTDTTFNTFDTKMVDADTLSIMQKSTSSLATEDESIWVPGEEVVLKRIHNKCLYHEDCGADESCERDDTEYASDYDRQWGTRGGEVKKRCHSIIGRGCQRDKSCAIRSDSLTCASLTVQEKWDRKDKVCCHATDGICDFYTLVKEDCYSDMNCGSDTYCNLEDRSKPIGKCLQKGKRKQSCDRHHHCKDHFCSNGKCV